jgi:uncharacterized sulfatase
MNLIFLVLDTHRRDRLGMYGFPGSVSPNLDDFARRSIIFENAVSPAQWTIPSHASMFSGEYPATHQTTQSSQSLDPFFMTIAEYLSEAGYRNTAFCNNPLVGVLDNGLKRGFDRFYNYGGAVPTVPTLKRNRFGSPFKRLAEYYTQFLRRISYPIQNAVAKSDRILGITLNPHLVPLWTRFANFKGDTARSISDAALFVKSEDFGKKQNEFVFINLMETHLPFTPPDRFIEKFAPVHIDNPEAKDFMTLYNTKALDWLLPVDPPFNDLERTTLSQMYNAEVAYQDFLLAELLDVLEDPYHRDNSLVIISSDHGELLGEHNFMGHGFRVYQELVHVPLLIRHPGCVEGYESPDYVSTIQLFHTMLDASGIDLHNHDLPGKSEINSERIQALSLLRSRAKLPEFEYLLAEAYPPENLLTTISRTRPEFLEMFECRAIYRALFDRDHRKAIFAGRSKLDMYDICEDPFEQSPGGINENKDQMQKFETALEELLIECRQRQPENWVQKSVVIDDDLVSQRLKNLGYLE